MTSLARFLLLESAVFVCLQDDDRPGSCCWSLQCLFVSRRMTSLARFLLLESAVFVCLQDDDRPGSCCWSLQCLFVSRRMTSLARFLLLESAVFVCLQDDDRPGPRCWSLQCLFVSRRMVRPALGAGVCSVCLFPGEWSARPLVLESAVFVCLQEDDRPGPWCWSLQCLFVSRRMTGPALGAGVCSVCLSPGG